MPAAAQRWLQHHSVLGPNDSVIIGVSHINQLEGNIKDWYVNLNPRVSFPLALTDYNLVDRCSEGGPLPEDVLRVLDEANIKAKGVEPYYAD